MTEAREHLRTMLQQRSVRTGSVKLASGKSSDWFVDCKQSVLTAAGHVWAGELLFDALQELETRPTAVAGVVLGGCPLASAVAQTSYVRGTALDAVYVRKESKGHGSQRKIEGDDGFGKDAPIAVVEDVVTTGGSTLRAIEALRARPFRVVGVVALIDRLEGGADNIAAAGIPFRSVFKRSDFE